MMRTFLMVAVLVIPTIRAQVLFEEGFDKKGVWGSSGYAHYGRGFYHIKAEDGRMIYYDGKKFQDFDAEVRTEFIDGKEDRGYGLMFRAQDYENYYEFDISANGYFRVGGEHNDKWSVISPWETSDAIVKNGVNYLRVSCRGDEFIFFVNGKEVKSLQNGRLLQGYIGIAAYGDAHIHFDDVKVYKRGSIPEIAYNFDYNVLEDPQDYGVDAEAIHIENFTDKSGGWSETDFAHYEPGYYKMYDTKEGRFSWQYGHETDFLYETRLRITEWPKGGLVGIVVRITDSKNYYGLFLNQEGKFFFEKSYDGSVNRLIMPTAVSFDPNQVIVLGLKPQGDQFTIFLNGQQLAECEDGGGGLENGNFGFYTSRGTGADFLSLKLSSLPFTWSRLLPPLRQFINLWPFFLVGIGVVLLVMKNRRKKETVSRQQRVGQIVDMVKANRGTMGLGELMVKYKISKRAALDLMENVASDYGGVARATMDGGLEYDFPDLMPSEEKLQHDVLQLATMRKGRITVTETAQHLKQDISETETMLDLMVDNKRVRKVMDGGVTFYEFVEIRKK